MEQTSETKEIIFLGTGHAMVTRCYNTCFAIRRGEEYFLVDGGGGNGILSQLEKAGILCHMIRGMFVTHGHTDHVLGAVWMIRKVAAMLLAGKYPGTFTIYCHKELWEMMYLFCKMMLHDNYLQFFGKEIQICILEDGDRHEILGMPVRFFDIRSTKAKQFGFQMQYERGNVLTCLGDEPCRQETEKWVKDSDWLLCEAFCLYEDREIFKPYEKYHSTVMDAAVLAKRLGVKNLVLYHTEDSDLVHRRERYMREAKEHFPGRIYVPDDLEHIAL